MNLYQYCGNNPVNFVDPLGLSPTAEEAMSYDDLVWRLQQFQSEHPGLTSEELIAALYNYMIESCTYNLYGGRYFETGDGHTIDFLHFITAAYYALSCGEGITNILGWGNELRQLLSDPESAAPFGGNEDLYSNAAGADFGDECVDNTKNLSDNILDYMKGHCGGVQKTRPIYSPAKKPYKNGRDGKPNITYTPMAG